MLEQDEFTFLSVSETDTAALGKALATIAEPGDVFALFGTLGMGKSVLSRAFIQALTATKEVPSPTFTLLQTYEAPGFEICHFDLYRLKSPEEIFEIGMEDALYSSVSLIEWPEQMGGYLPRDIFKVVFTPADSGRKITITAYSPKRKRKLACLKEAIHG